MRAWLANILCSFYESRTMSLLALRTCIVLCRQIRVAQIQKQIEDAWPPTLSDSIEHCTTLHLLPCGKSDVNKYLVSRACDAHEQLHGVGAYPWLRRRMLRSMFTLAPKIDHIPAALALLIKYTTLCIFGQYS